IINHDGVVPFKQPEPVTISEKAAIKFKPQLHIGNGCHAYPAVNIFGQTSGGLKITGAPSAGCKGSGWGSQVYGRSTWFNDVWAIMYSWYFPKDSPSTGLGHRHDWEHVTVWIDNPDVPEPKILGVTPSAHSGYSSQVPPDADTVDGTSVKVIYESKWPINHALESTSLGGDFQDLIMWEQMSDAARFSDFDTSGDGSIAASELIVLMESMGIATTIEKVQELIDKVDENKSGELEYPEFVRLVSDIRRGNGDTLAIFLQYSKHVMAIRRELLDLNANPTANSQVFGVKENAWEWKVLIRGPAGSPYEDGVFNFCVRFGHEYPFEPPVLSCLTRIYHPNFVPLLNGSMSLYGLLRRWDPEWRMRRLFEEVEKLLAAPDEELIAQFEGETAQVLLGNGVDTRCATASIVAMSKAKAARHPRVITLECITSYRNNHEAFSHDARKLTCQCASTSTM
ncbi:hypothetical protein PHMEG_00024307, partial [Phytophthora megakarya]